MVAIMIKNQKLEIRAKTMTLRDNKSDMLFYKSSKIYNFLFISIVVLFGALVIAQSVNAATTENVEEVVKIKKSSISLAEVSDASSDPTPFGVNLKSVIIVNERVFGEKIKDRKSLSGIDTSSAGIFNNGDKLQRLLDKFLDKPVSFKLIQDIQAEVVQYYRQNQLKLMSVNVPPQEISDGGLQINVLPFILGEVIISGNKIYSTKYLRKNIRSLPGQPIDTNALIGDLDWLAQNPFRIIQGGFKPGSEYGTTDIILNVSEERPYSFIIGASNSGSIATNKERVFGGVSIARLASNDDVFSYIGMIDPINFARRQFVDINSRKGFLSHTFKYASPLDLGGIRSKFNVQAQFLSTISQNALVASIQSQSRTQIYSSELSFPQRKWVGALSLTPELYTRVELKRSNQDTLFNFTRLSNTNKTSYLSQFPIGLRGTTDGQLLGFSSQGYIDAMVVLGRGKKDGVEEDAYGYFGYMLKQDLTLPSSFTLGLSSHGQYTRNNLPSLNQAGIGGDGSVRGYESNEIATEKAVVASVELKKNTAIPLGDNIINASPYGFFDIGYAGALGTRSKKFISSGGIGFDFDLGASAVLKTSIARAFHAGVLTKSQSVSAHINIVARF